MKVSYLLVAVLAFTLFGCDDNTANLGIGMLPGGDGLTIHGKTFKVTTNSVLADSVFAKTSTGFLGKYTDKEFGYFEADFLTQFNCSDNFEFPESIVSNNGAVIDSVQINFLYSSYFGDSLTPCRMSVYELDKDLATSNYENYYTNIKPADFYNENKAPLAQKVYTAVDLSVSDSVRAIANYSNRVTVKLPKLWGQNIFDKYKSNKEFFKNSETFIENVCKGIYAKADYGDGTILYIQGVQLSLYFQYKIKSENNTTGIPDSTITGRVIFAGTKEVVQANRFQSDKSKLEALVSNPDRTYLKTPAGIFTEATLPINDIMGELKTDTINSAKIAFTSYNNTGDSKMTAPAAILLIRKKDMRTFFEKNMLPDGVSSFLAQHSKQDNNYSFNNITRLLTTCANEKLAEKEKLGINWNEDEFEAEHPDWNKVYLVPVVITAENESKQITSVQNDLKLNSAALKGGLRDNPSNKIDLNLIYTKLNQ